LGNNSRAVGLWLLAALWVLLSVARASAQDWNQWRGPARDGKAAGFTAPATWPKELTRKWTVEVGIGHASPLLVGDAVYVFARQGDDEVIRRLDATTGREVWHASYPAPYEVNPAAQGHGKGPKSTPVYADGRLYTLGISGILSSLDARTGKVLWQHDFKGQFKSTSPQFGTAMSPIVEGGLLIAHVGGQEDGAITAFDARTGAVRWRWTGDGPAYASPIAVTLGGVRQIVTQTQKMCVGIAADSGKLLWSMPFTTMYDQNAVTPVVAGDTVVFAGLQKPMFACRIRKNGAEWAAEKVWETRDAMMYLSTPVLSGDRLYALATRRQGQMVCLDAATGKTLWAGDGRLGENASVWDAGPALLVLTTDSVLHVYRKDGAVLAEAARYEVAGSPVWASPAFGKNRLLVKDETTLALWQLP
jgi:outer membrane protein assembly factor BamB